MAPLLAGRTVVCVERGPERLPARRYDTRMGETMTPGKLWRNLRSTAATQRTCGALLLAVLVALLPAASLWAQMLDPQALALTASDLGPGWTVEEAERDGPFFMASFSHLEAAPLQFAGIVIGVGLSNANGASLVNEFKESLGQEFDLHFEPWPGLGDGPAFHGRSTDPEAAAMSTFVFQVGSVATLVWVVGGSSQGAQVDQQALRIALLQQDKLRANLAPPAPEAPPATPTPTGPPFCEGGHVPEYQFGFAALKAQLGDLMGDPVECEHTNPDNGDSLQQTSKGLAFYRKSTNTPTFTNGHEHWALTAQGLVYWTGDSIDPPADAQPVPAPAVSPATVGASLTP